MVGCLKDKYVGKKEVYRTKKVYRKERERESLDVYRKKREYTEQQSIQKKIVYRKKREREPVCIQE